MESKMAFKGDFDGKTKVSKSIWAGMDSETRLRKGVTPGGRKYAASTSKMGGKHSYTTIEVGDPKNKPGKYTTQSSRVDKAGVKKKTQKTVDTNQRKLSDRIVVTPIKKGPTTKVKK